MSATETDINNLEERHLKLKTTAEIEGPDGEHHGYVYSGMLRQLQIHPLLQEDWFMQNLRPIRNKRWARSLIAKGDTASLRALSEKCVTALGRITWSIGDRRWLLSEQQLDEGEQLLIYKPPGTRDTGDHDRFYPPMDAMFKEMRSRIFTPRTVVADAGTTIVKKARSQPKKIESAITQEARSHNSLWSPIAVTPNEIVPPGKWSEKQSEEAILYIVRTLNDARLNSDEQIFERVFKRFMARLSEIEYVEDLGTANREGRDLHREDERISVASTPITNDDDTMEVDTDESSINSQADLYLQLNSPLCSQKVAFASQTAAQMAFAHQYQHTKESKSPISTQAQAKTSPISGSLLSYLPAAYPGSMSAYITPYSSANTVAPCCWLDAPCLPSSYAQFVSGVRLRANVPISARESQLVIVLAYGWNDFCRVLRDEEDWMHGFQKDLQRAAERDRVDVWRIRVCCFA